MGTPSKVEEEDGFTEVWEYIGEGYGYDTRLFCLSSNPTEWAKAKESLVIVFYTDRVCEILGGCLSVRGSTIAQAGKTIDQKALTLGIPATGDRPLPPYYQCMFWKESEWVVKIESEKAVISVSLSDPCQPPEEI